MNLVLDASAVLAVLLQEPGQDVAAAAIDGGAGVSAANLAEVMTRLVRDGVPIATASRTLQDLPVTVFELDADLAIKAGALSALTTPFGLSLGDRCCLALAIREDVPALTADRIWQQAGPVVGVTVRLIR